MAQLPALRPDSKPRFTLHELLNIMERRDDSDVWEQFRDDEPEDVALLTKEKIDGYHEVILALEDDAKRLKERAKHFRDLAEIQERKAQRIENRLRFTMRFHQCERLPGVDFNAVTGKRKTLVIREPRISMEHFMRFGPYIHCELYWSREPTWADMEALPDAVSQRFKWDDKACRQAFKDGTAPEELKGFVDYEDKETFKWEVRKKL